MEYVILLLVSLNRSWPTIPSRRMEGSGNDSRTLRFCFMALYFYFLLLPCSEIDDGNSIVLCRGIHPSSMHPAAHHRQLMSEPTATTHHCNFLYLMDRLTPFPSSASPSAAGYTLLQTYEPHHGFPERAAKPCPFAKA